MSLRRTLLSLVALSVVVGLLPASSASAAVNRAPKIKKAVMKDANGNDLADRVVLIYNEKIKHKLDKSRFPFRVEGYQIRKIKGAKGSRRLVVLLKENANAPLRPASISYKKTRKQPVLDMKNKQARKQLLTKNIIGLTVTSPPPPPPGEEFTLLVSKAGDGLGTVSDNGSKINCGPTCSASYPKGTTVTLTATPDAASKATFGSWSGCTSSTNTCTVTMDADKAVTASFSKAGTFLLSVVKDGAGSGAVTSTSQPTQASQINCGSTCSVAFAKDTEVTLTAAPDQASQSLFAGWSGGGCTGTSLSCKVTMDAAKTVNATFNKAAQFVLTVTKSGNGTVTSTSTPAQASQINCGTTCQASYPAATQVTLTAQPDQVSGANFSGWSGDGCTGSTNTCTITMDAAKTVTATFGAATQRSLTVEKAGDGDGTVTSTSTPSQPAQVECGATCQVSYPNNTTVTLTAAADSASDFAGWSGGGCTGTSPTCNVTMDAAKTVTATFNKKPVGGTYTLSVTATGGTVACTPPPSGMTAGCNGSYAAGTPVLITVTPADLAALTASWVGCEPAVPGSLTCTVIMDANKVVSVSLATTTVGTGLQQP